MNDHGDRSRFALKNCARGKLEFLRAKSGARGHALIHMESDRRAADGVLDSVFDVRHAGDRFDCIADFWRPGFQQVKIFRKQLDFDRIRANW